jgi:hypothetical protein
MPRSTPTSRILLSFACLLACALTRVAAQNNGNEQVANWQAYLEDHPDTSKYRLVFEWDHIHNATIFVDGENGGRVYNAESDVRCNGNSSVVASDGRPYWMPRFFPRPVSAEITAVTGVRFASADWQPCGHKEITICHAESHYDFHMYYEDEETMNNLPMCQIGVPTNPDLPVCQDSATSKINHDYFRLVNHSIPLTMSMSRSAMETADTTTLLDGVQKNFCVDPSSAVLRSGVHYGDASETLEEWTTPVTIIGSHDCQLKFFEPMFSWKWVSGCVPQSQTSWPVFEVANIEYTQKGIESLPDSWKIEVSEACKAQSCFPGQMDPPLSEVCHIKLTAEGTKCPAEGCALLKECGNIKDCSTGMPYVSPWTGDDEVGMDDTVDDTTSTPANTGTDEPEPTSPPAVTEEDPEKEVDASSDAAVSFHGAKNFFLVALTARALFN